MWAGMAAPMPGTGGELAALFQSRLEDPATIPFAVTDGRTGALLGTTSLRDYVPAQQRLEIGGTFYGRQFWGSHVNPASKHMLLAYAYEVLEVHRVAFRCDARNTRSATAIERLGAQFEGILRGHRAAPGGGRADTAVFSILSQEWPHSARRPAAPPRPLRRRRRLRAQQFRRLLEIPTLSAGWGPGICRHGVRFRRAQEFVGKPVGDDAQRFSERALGVEPSGRHAAQPGVVLGPPGPAEPVGVTMQEPSVEDVLEQVMVIQGDFGHQRLAVPDHPVGEQAGRFCRALGYPGVRRVVAQAQGPAPRV